MKRVIDVTYHFIIELMVCVLFIFLFYINKNILPPLVLIILLSISSIILFTLLIQKLLTKGIWIYLAITIPSLFLISKQSDVSLFMLAILGSFIFWRGLVLYNDPLRHSVISLLLLSFVIGVVDIAYAAISHYPYQLYLISLLFVELLYVLIGSFIRNWDSVAQERSKFAVYYLKLFVGIVLIGIALSFFLKYAQIIFFMVLRFIVLVFTVIASPFQKILVYLISLMGKEEIKRNPFESDAQSEAGDYQEQSYVMFDHIWYFILAIGVIIFIVYLVKKNRWRIQPLTKNPVSVIQVSEDPISHTPSLLFRRRMKPPEDAIRKEIFYLQKYADKFKSGRLPNESLEEWWERIGIIASGRAIETYKKVRYGGVRASHEEQLQMKADIRDIKLQLKDRVKKEKKTSKK